MIPGVTAIGDEPISAIGELENVVTLDTFTMTAGVGGEFKLYAATLPFITMLDDTPSQARFLGTLRKSFSYSRSIVQNAGFGGLSVSIGDFELDNNEADYDDIEVNYSIDGAEVVLKVGEVNRAGRADYASFFTVATLIAQRKTADEETFRITVVDKSFLLDLPAQPNVYAGTGDLEGGTEVAGKRKPWALGWLTNITPAPVIPTEAVYQVSWRSVQAISAVYDTGVPYDFDADYANSTLLRNATLVPGQYATCVSEGLFRLGGSAFGPVTADVEGDDEEGFVETTGDIVQLIATTGAGLTSDDIADNTFDLLNLNQPAPVGYFISHENNELASTVINNLMTGIRGYAVFSLQFGLFETGLFEEPTFVSSADYTDIKAKSIRREALPSDINPPPYRFRVRYARNWTQLESVAGEEDDNERIAYLKSEGKLATSDETVGRIIQVDHPFASDPAPIEGYFRDEEDATDLANTTLNLYATTPSMHRVILSSHPFVHELGETIKITKARFDLTDGKFLVLVQVEDSIDNAGSQEVIGVG